MPKVRRRQSDSVSDAGLIPKAQGDPEQAKEALGGLFEEHAVGVRQLAEGITHSRDEADDVTQETFLKAVRRIDQVKPDDFRGWLYTIAKNTSIDAVRRGRRERPASQIDSDDSAASKHFEMQERETGRHPTKKSTFDFDLIVDPKAKQPDEVLWESQVNEILWAEVNKLPARHRGLTLLWLKGEENREIAGELGLEEDTVKVRLSEARRALRERLLRRLGGE